MKTSELVIKYNGQYVNIDGDDNKECTAIPHAFEQGNGWPLTYGNAKDMPAQADTSYYQVINYTPGFVPIDGDIPCWNSNWGEGAGHTAVAVVYGAYTANANTFYCFEQNDGDNGLAHVSQHNYGDVEAFIRPIHYNQGEEMASVADTDFDRRVADSVWGLNGIYSPTNALNGDLDAQFAADPEGWGGDPLTVMQTRFDADEAKAYRDWLVQTKTLADMVPALQQQITELQSQINQPMPPTPEPQPEPEPTPIPEPPKVYTLWERIKIWLIKKGII